MKNWNSPEENQGSFDVGDFIAKHCRRIDVENFQSKLYKQVNNAPQSDFKQTVSLIEAHFDAIFDTNDIEKSQERLRMQHNAIIGIPKAVSYFKDEITDFLRKNNLVKVAFPDYYHNLSDAIFHDLFGLGPLAAWYDYPNSQAAHIIGTAMFFEVEGSLVRQQTEFESVDRVTELVRSLILKDPRSKINEYSPKLEIDMEDGTRVTLFIPPLSRKISITFRRFTVQNLSFEEQAAHNTVPSEAVTFFKALAMSRPNTMIVGPVKCGKTTMLNTFYGVRDHNQKVVCVEKHQELRLSDHYPSRPLDELLATEEELLKLFPSILRTDFLYLIVGELRSVEAELCMQGCERGSTGLLTTYHTKHPHNIPGQLARLILENFPNRRFDAELVRVANNIDFVIVMDQLPDKSKRVESIVELRLDPISLRVSSHQILKYEPLKGAWYYKFDLSDSLLEKLNKNNPEWAKILIDSLNELSQKNSLTGDTVTYANDLINFSS